MTNTNKNIGKRIREIRKEKNISAETMADNLSVSLSTYQRIESGETNSWALHLDDISKSLNVPIEEIILDKERYIQIVKEQSTGYMNTDTVINNLSEKVIELYEKRLLDKDLIISDRDKRIAVLEKMLNQKE